MFGNCQMSSDADEGHNWNENGIRNAAKTKQLIL